MNKTLRAALVVVSIVFGGATGASAASIVIDDLTQGQQLVVLFGQGSQSNTVSGLNPAHVIGGSRQLTLSLGAGIIEALIANTGTNRLDLNLAIGTGFGSAFYNANGAAGGLNQDFLAAQGATLANTFFQASIASSDPNLGFTVAFFDGVNTATFSTTLGSGASFIDQAFGSFANAGAVDFTSIDSVRVTLNAPQAQNASMSLFEVTTTPLTEVPEPASLLLLGSGLAVARRWRTRA